MNARSLCLLLLCSAPALADFKAAYRDGLKAAERKDWPKVEAQMRAALAEEPSPNARVRFYGMRYDPYIPHFYLGLAAYSRGDCRAALGFFNNAAHRAIIDGIGAEFARQKTMTDRCQTQLAQTPTDAPAPTKPVAAVADQPASTAQPQSVPRPVPTQTASTPARVDQARLASVQRQLKLTQSRLDAITRELRAPGGDPAWTAQQRGLSADLNRISGSLSGADNTRLDTLGRELAALDGRAAALAQAVGQAAAQARNKALADAKQRLAQSMAAARETAQSAPAADAAGLRDQIANAQAQVNSDNVASVVEATRVLDAATATLRLRVQERQAVVAMRTALRPLIDAFLAGEYARAAAWRDEAALRDYPKARAQMLLLRAAARFEIYVLGAESDATVLETVRQDVRQARSLDTQLAPSTRAFSPRFRALFASTR